MNKLNNLIAAFAIAALFFSCNLFKKATVSEADMEQQGFLKAMVVTMELDGCSYMIELESNKKKLEPDGLQPEFQKDSLKVWIKYQQEDRMSVCMAGETIKLMEIKVRQ